MIRVSEHKWPAFWVTYLRVPRMKCTRPVDGINSCLHPLGWSRDLMVVAPKPAHPQFHMHLDLFDSPRMRSRTPTYAVADDRFHVCLPGYNLFFFFFERVENGSSNVRSFALRRTSMSCEGSVRPTNSLSFYVSKLGDEIV